MKIKNKSRNILVAENALIVRGLMQKIFGLIPYKKPTAMIFRTRLGIHTFFMRYPIDIVVLDKNQRVVKIKINLMPNKLFFCNPYYSLIAELPSGSISKSCIEEGDILEFL